MSAPGHIGTATDSLVSKRTKYHQAVDGEWYRVNMHMRGFKDACCDCGLVHKVNFRIVDGALVTKAVVDKRATAAMRRTFRYKGSTK
jgi:hypothetical protein